MILYTADNLPFTYSVSSVYVEALTVLSFNSYFYWTNACNNEMQTYSRNTYQNVLPFLSIILVRRSGSKHGLVF